MRERDMRERDMRERDNRERDIREWDIGENVVHCEFAEYLLLHIDIRGVSGCLSLKQSWCCWVRFLWCHKPEKYSPLRV